MNVPKTLPAQLPKCAKKLLRRFSGTFLKSFLVHSGRGGGGVFVHFAPEQDVFWYKVENFWVFTTTYSLFSHATFIRSHDTFGSPPALWRYSSIFDDIFISPVLLNGATKWSCKIVLQDGIANGYRRTLHKLICSAFAPRGNTFSGCSGTCWWQECITKKVRKVYFRCNKPVQGGSVQGKPLCHYIFLTWDYV